MTSIYQQIRAEGYRDGLSQASLVNYDDAYYRGQQSAWAEAPSRFTWFVIGFGCATGLIFLIRWLA